jgi:hypothetical protein
VTFWKTKHMLQAVYVYCIYYIGLEVLEAVTMNITIFWDVILCTSNPVQIHRLRAFRLLLSGHFLALFFFMKMEASHSSESMENFYWTTWGHIPEDINVYRYITFQIMVGDFHEEGDGKFDCLHSYWSTNCCGFCFNTTYNFICKGTLSSRRARLMCWQFYFIVFLLVPARVFICLLLLQSFYRPVYSLFYWVLLRKYLLFFLLSYLQSVRPF